MPSRAINLEEGNRHKAAARRRGRAGGPAPEEASLFDPTNHREGGRDPEERAGTPVDPQRLLRALRQGAGTLATVTVLGGLGGLVAAAAWVHPEYEAAVVLQWEKEKNSGDDEARALATVLEAVKLPENLSRVQARLGLSASPEEIGRRVAVISSFDSNVVTLRATATDGRAAEALASAATDAFLEHRVTRARERFEESARVLTANMERARETLLHARREYHELLAEHGVADLVSETKAAVDQAARLRADSQLARADSQAEAARADALGRVARGEPRTSILQETEIAPEARRLAEGTAELSALRAQLSADHPRVRALEAQVSALRARATAPTERAAGDRTIGRNPQWEAAQQGMVAALAQRDAARSRVEALTQAAQEAQEALTRLSRIEGEASKRRARAKAAEDHLAVLESKIAEAQDAARAPSTGFRVITRTTAPDRPARSRRPLVVIGAPLCALLLATVAVLLRALRGLRVRTAAELAYWGRAPVIAASTWPREADALADLVADLTLCLRRAPGTTALLGLGHEEARWVAALAERLAAPGVSAVSPWLPLVERRRTVREAGRAVVLVAAGRHGALDLGALRTALGRDAGIGLVLLGVTPDLADLPDRAGAVELFWLEGGADPAA